jgi:hypothetical protein
MTNYTIADLRRRLFETIDGVRRNTIDLDKAKTISELSQVIVNTAKVEVEYLRATGGEQSAFIGADEQGDPSLEPLSNGISSITRHTLKG